MPTEELTQEENELLKTLNVKTFLKDLFRKKPKEQAPKEEEPAPSTGKLLVQFFKEAKKEDKKGLYSAMGYSLLQGAGGGILPLLNGNVLSNFGTEKFTSWIIAYVAGVTGQSICSDKAMTARNKLGTSVAANTLISKFKELKKYPMQFFYQKENSASNIQRRIGNISGAKAEYLNVTTNFLGQTTGVISASAVLFYTSPAMGVIALAATGAYSICGQWAVKKFRKAREKSRNIDTKNADVVIDITNHVDMLKRYQQTGKATTKIATAQKKSKLFSDKIFALANKVNTFLDCFTNVAIFGAASLYAAIIAKETGDIGQFAIITGATLTMANRGMFASNCWRRLTEVRNQYLEENKKLQIPEKMNVKTGQKQLQANNSKIEIKNVSFMYPDYEQEGKQQPQKPTDNQKEDGFKGIENASVSFEKGGLQTIIGRSGQGKSTLLHLMAHIYDVDKGEITIGGVNIKETSEETMLGYMGIMSQKDGFLQTYSVRENLEMLIPSEEDLVKAKEKQERGEISAERYKQLCEFAQNPQEKIDDALKRAQIYNTYYDTPNGKPNYDKSFREFSGGEAQRLMLARAILADNEIIVLDEPTSALDTKTAMEMAVELKKLAQEKNVIVVTHAPDIVSNSDKVVVVENGHITGEGGPFTLCQTNEYFKSQYKPAEILNARKKFLECAGADDLEVSKKLVAQNRIDATYGSLKNALKENPKELFKEMRSFVEEYHGKAPDDTSRAVQKQILEDKELGQSYVKASKQELKKRRSAKQGR